MMSSFSDQVFHKILKEFKYSQKNTVLSTIFYTLASLIYTIFLLTTCLPSFYYSFFFSLTYWILLAIEVVLIVIFIIIFIFLELSMKKINFSISLDFKKFNILSINSVTWLIEEYENRLESNKNLLQQILNIITTISTLFISNILIHHLTLPLSPTVNWNIVLALFSTVIIWAISSVFVANNRHISGKMLSYKLTIIQLREYRYTLIKNAENHASTSLIDKSKNTILIRKRMLLNIQAKNKNLKISHGNYRQKN